MASPSWQGPRAVAGVRRCPEINQVIRPWDGDVGHTLQKGGRPGKSHPPPGPRAAMIGFCGALGLLPHMTTRSLAASRPTVQTCQSLAWQWELLPVFPCHYCDGNPRLWGRKHCFPIALQVPENPGTASRNHLTFLFPLLSTAAAEAPVSIHLLSPVGQTLGQVLDATMLILLLPGTLHCGCYSHTERETVPRSKPCS